MQIIRNIDAKTAQEEYHYFSIHDFSMYFVLFYEITIWSNYVRSYYTKMY